MAEKKRKLLAVIDGKSVFYRGYYAMPNLTTRDGMPTGGVYGFTSMSVELIKRLKPDYVAVAWDKAKTNIRSRKKIYPEYKAGRKPPPPDFYDQIPILNELLEGFGWPLYELDDYEADDILGALSVQANEQDIEVALITSDLDALQLITPLTQVYALKKGLSNIEQFDVASFEAKYGISVHQFLDLKALKGDSSDNLPGVAGIGEKTGLDLLKTYKTLDNIYDNLNDIKETTRKKLEAGRESAYMTKKVAELWCDAPVKLDLKAMDVKNYDRQKLQELLTQLEFRGLLNRLKAELNDVGAGVQAAPKIKKQTNSKKNVTITNSGDLSSTSSLSTDKIVVGLSEEKLNLSDTKNIYSFYLSKLKTQDIQKLVQSILNKATSVVGYDVKDIMHKLTKFNLHIESDIFDVKIVGFLLNSLTRDKSLSALFGDGIDETNANEYDMAVWDLYEYQKQELKKLPKLEKLAYTVELPTIKILFNMENQGIKLDVSSLKKLEFEITDELNNIEKEIYKFAGQEFNINSPAQLSKILFETLELPTAGIKKGKTAYSTGAKELTKLKKLHPIIDQISSYRELSKLLSTYAKPLPKLVDENDYLHTTFMLDVAATGRLSSVNPNLQNIPIRTKEGNKIRESFIPTSGNVFVSADYSQFELRLAAVLAGDVNLINDFENDLDIHAKTASDVFNIPLNEVTKNQRRDAKVINFGVLYGMSPHGLSEATDMNMSEAKIFIDEYFKLRAPIKTYIENVINNAEQDGYVETLFGRRRPTPDIKSSNFIVREAAKRAAANMPIQGTEADLMKMAMLELEKVLDKDNHQILQIHDSIVVECAENQADTVAKQMKQVMENIYPELGIKLKVDVSTGKTWAEL